MNFKQFRKPQNGHSQMAKLPNGAIRGGRGMRLQSKLGQAIGLKRLEALLAEAKRTRSVITEGGTPCGLTPTKA